MLAAVAAAEMALVLLMVALVETVVVAQELIRQPAGQQEQRTPEVAAAVETTETVPAQQVAQELLSCAI
jgi:hypothetical protein